MRASVVAFGLCAVTLSSVATADVVTYIYRPQANPSVPIGSITFDDPTITADASWLIQFTVPLPAPVVTGFSFDLGSIGGPTIGLADILPGSHIYGIFSNSGSALDGSGDPDDIKIVTSLGTALFSIDSGPGADWVVWGTPTPWIQGDWVLLPAPGTGALITLAGLVGLRRRR